MSMGEHGDSLRSAFVLLGLATFFVRSAFFRAFERWSSGHRGTLARGGKTWVSGAAIIQRYGMPEGHKVSNLCSVGIVKTLRTLSTAIMGGGEHA